MFLLEWSTFSNLVTSLHVEKTSNKNQHKLCINNLNSKKGGMYVCNYVRVVSQAEVGLYVRGDALSNPVLLDHFMYA